MSAAGERCTVTGNGAPPFPDCWLAYGATNDELRRVGNSLTLPADSRTRLLFGGQVILAVALAIAALQGWAPIARALLAILAVVSALSAVTTLVRLLVTPRGLRFLPDALVLVGPIGASRRAVPWGDIAEIGLAQQGGRLAVGLRLRSRSSGAAAPVFLSPRGLRGGFDYLLPPPHGDPDELGRILLRYAIDPRFRRRLAT